VSEVERRQGAAPGEAGDGERLSEADSVAPSAPLGGQAGSASGGWGTGSETASSGGTGEGDEEASPGVDAQTDWLRDAPGGGPTDG
jgi:hypothetical protein